MSTDVQIIPEKTGDIAFSVLGASDDRGLMLLQRLYVLLLSNHGSGYRNGVGGYELLAFMHGGNIPEDGVISSILAVCCSDTLRMLDAEDRANVSSFTGYGENGKLKFELVLVDGTTIHGELQNV